MDVISAFDTGKRNRSPDREGAGIHRDQLQAKIEFGGRGPLLQKT
jgi:hypothetical protein